MSILKKTILPIAWCLLFSACTNSPAVVEVPLVKDSTRLTELPPPPKVEEEIPSRIDLQKKIKEKEKELFTSETLDVAKGKQMVRLYDTYHKYYYNDLACPEYLFKAGEITENMGQYIRAAEFYRMCCGEYGDAFKLRPECMFRLANVYDFKLNDYVRAKEMYETLIREYPKTQMAKDAASAIKLMGISDEDMIKKFEAQNKK
ncbi:MAG: tetratricopeptide repeat protein [Bacteroidetes bacterium]|nr:tetratricopeptide repeat protein [Bacteroidota bacterium]